jgi:hypothetical protein
MNTYNPGSNQTFTFTPNIGYLIDSVTVDGVKVDSLNSYTFYNLDDNHIIRVYFKLNTNSGLVSINFPTGISYQAIARDSTGAPLVNTTIKIKFSIKESSINGNLVYSETFQLVTNKLGLFTCVIGNGNSLFGNYKNIDWMGELKFLQVELEQSSGYLLLGTQQLLSVPYANSAKEASKIKNSTLPIFNDNYSALLGGLKVGEIYRMLNGVLKVVY